MTYTREVTNLIVYYWGKGLTAEETRTVIKEKTGKQLGLATIYRHRHSLTADQIIEILFTDQLRDIALATDIGLRLKYRDNLLGKLIPQKFQSFEFKHIEQRVKIDATDDEDTILSKAAAILDRKTKSQSIH